MSEGFRLFSGYLLIIFFIANYAIADGNNRNFEIPSEAPLSPVTSDSPTPSCGFIPPSVDLSHLRNSALFSKLDNIRLPAIWDWRQRGMVTPVRDQNFCNSCYAYAALADIESKMLIDGIGSYDFSENNVKECNWYESSCGGANHLVVPDYLAKKGIVLETCDPYVDGDVSCNPDCPYFRTLTEWRMIAGNVTPPPEILKYYISTFGPVQASMYAGHGDYWAYEFSTYNGSYPLYYNGAETPNHLVLLVGWNDYIKHNGGIGAWIAKNSWGTDWGGTCGFGTEEGYFMIAYGSASIGQYSSFFHGWQNYDYYGNLLYHDEGGWSNSWGYGHTIAWAMSRFVPATDLTATRIEFWTTDATVDIDIYIYDGFADSLFDLITSIHDISYPEAGYYSLPLNSPLDFGAGDDFFVAVRFINENYHYPVAGDRTGPAQASTSYISQGGTVWYDIGENGQNDVCLRVRCRSGECIDSDGDSFGDPGYPGNECPADNCPYVWNYYQTDSDMDSHADSCDNCPQFSNPGQADDDLDGVGNECDICLGHDDAIDTDSDSTPDGCDICPGYDDNSDTDGDSVPDDCDICHGYDDNLDMDGNGIPDDCDYLCGDPNGDATVNVADVVYLINHIFHSGAAPTHSRSGDVNCDQATNIADAVYLGNYIFSNESPDLCLWCE